MPPMAVPLVFSRAASRDPAGGGEMLVVAAFPVPIEAAGVQFTATSGLCFRRYGLLPSERRAGLGGALVTRPRPRPPSSGVAWALSRRSRHLAYPQSGATRPSRGRTRARPRPRSSRSASMEVEIGIRQDHAADVAAVENGTATVRCLGGELPLQDTKFI